MRTSRGFSSLIVAGTFLAAAQAQPVVVHKMVIAASPETALANKTVDAVIQSMNAIMAAKSYGWDFPCPQVGFEKDGAVRTDTRIPTIGRMDEFRKARDAVVPMANFVVAFNVACAGDDFKNTSGCTNLSLEPSVVTIMYEDASGSRVSPSLTAQLWLHERGHSVSLKHPFESPVTDASAGIKESDGMRFMFWYLAPTHLGKTNDECKSFEQARLSSVTRRANVAAGGNAVSMAKGPTLLAQQVVQPGGITPTPKDPQTRIENDLKLTGLTLPAYQSVDPLVWVEGIPLGRIMRLQPPDLDSIRKMLQGKVNSLWPQAVQVLGIRGVKEDIRILRRTIDEPLPPLTDPNETSEDKINYRRILLHTKLVAPQAMGVLANRVESEAAVEELGKLVDLKTAESKVGATSATTFSKSALKGLSMANTVAAKAIMNRYLESGLKVMNEFEGKPGANYAVVPLTREEANHLTATSKRIGDIGIDAYIAGNRAPQ